MNWGKVEGKRQYKMAQKSCTNLAPSEILGHKVKDVISGFEGRVTGYVIYLSGCNQLNIVPEYDKKAKKWPEAHWIDVQRAVIVDKSQRVTLDNRKTPGHDEPPAERETP